MSMVEKETRNGITIYGKIGRDIDPEAYEQLEKAYKLHIVKLGALLPDAHVGYALPVGGVAALDNFVSPAFVGFDIACRMKMSILDIKPSDFEKHRESLAATLDGVTSFGLGAYFKDGKRDYRFIDDSRWNEINVARNLKDKEWLPLE